LAPRILVALGIMHLIHRQLARLHVLVCTRAHAAK
jgi:hypothetical protein